MVGIDVILPGEPPPNLSREQLFVPPGEEGDDPRQKRSRYW